MTRTVRRHDSEVPLSLLHQHDGHLISERRHGWRLQQRPVGALPDLDRLPIPVAPQSVSRTAGRHVEQRGPAESWRQRAGRWQRIRLDIALLGEAIENRHAPQRSRRRPDGGDQPAAIGARRNRQVPLESDAHTTRHFALHIESPEPRSGPVGVGRHIEHGSGVDRRHVANVAVVIREPFRRRTASRLDPPDVILGDGVDALREVDPLTVHRPGRKVVVNVPVLSHAGSRVRCRRCRPPRRADPRHRR